MHPHCDPFSLDFLYPEPINTPVIATIVPKNVPQNNKYISALCGLLNNSNASCFTKLFCIATIGIIKIVIQNILRIIN